MIEPVPLFLKSSVVLAILAFPYSYQILGYAGATLSIFFIGLSTYYTSYILWKFCMKHPQIRDIADAAEVLTGSRIGWYAAFIGLALNK